MKISDLLIFKELGDIQRLLVAQQKAINDRFDRLDRLLIQQTVCVSPELEEAIKTVAARAINIDEKVPNKQ